MDRQAFVDHFGPLANDISQKTGLDPSLVLGVVGQETGWGDSVSGNNIFGISPGGRVAAYPDVGTAGQAFVDLINNRYPNVSQASSPDAQAKALVAGGYNRVDPNYAKNVSARANTVRQVGFNAPSVDDLTKMVQPDQTPAIPNAPSSDDLMGMVRKDGFSVQPPSQSLGNMQTLSPEEQANMQKNTASADAMTPQPGNRTGQAAGQTLGSAGSAIANAASEGYNSTSIPLLNSLGAIYRGGQQALIQTGEAVGPNTQRLATDVASMPEAFAGMRTPMMEKAGTVYGIGKDAIKQAGADATAANIVNSTNVANPSFTPPTGPSSFQPQSVGAAASGPTNPLTAGQRATYERGQLNQTALDRAQNGADPAEYIPGVKPTLGSVEYTTKNAVDEKTLQATNPTLPNGQKFADALKAQADDNNLARKGFFKDRAGDPIELENMENAREAQKEVDLGHAWSAKRDVDVEPTERMVTDSAGNTSKVTGPSSQGFVDQVQSILDGPAGKETAIKNALNAVKSSMYDRAGNLEVDPEMLYGVRRNLANMLGKAAKAETPTLQYAASQLATLKDSLDNLIESGAPGYQTYLQNWHSTSQAIDTMEVLQKYLTGTSQLTDVNGVMQFKPVQTMMDHIVTQRQASGINPAKSIPDATMDDLFNLRNDLARESQKSSLMKVPGSDTVQLTNNAGVLGTGPLGTAVRRAANVVAHTALGKMTGGVGNAALEYTIKPIVKSVQEAKAAKANQARAMELLSSSPKWEGSPY